MYVAVPFPFMISPEGKRLESGHIAGYWFSSKGLLRTGPCLGRDSADSRFIGKQSYRESA